MYNNKNKYNKQTTKTTGYNNNQNKTITSYLQVQLTTTKLQLQGKRENHCHHIAGPSISKSF